MAAKRYVDDIVDGLERLFWQLETDYVGPVNIGNDRDASVLDIAQFISKLVPVTYYSCTHHPLPKTRPTAGRT